MLLLAGRVMTKVSSPRVVQVSQTQASPAMSALDILSSVAHAETDAVSAPSTPPQASLLLPGVRHQSALTSPTVSQQGSGSRRAGSAPSGGRRKAVISRAAGATYQGVSVRDVTGGSLLASHLVSQGHRVTTSQPTIVTASAQVLLPIRSTSYTIMTSESGSFFTHFKCLLVTHSQSSVAL